MLFHETSHNKTIKTKVVKYTCMRQPKQVPVTLGYKQSEALLPPHTSPFLPLKFSHIFPQTALLKTTDTSTKGRHRLLLSAFSCATENPGHC